MITDTEVLKLFSSIYLGDHKDAVSLKRYKMTDDKRSEDIREKVGITDINVSNRQVHVKCIACHRGMARMDETASI